MWYDSCRTMYIPTCQGADIQDIHFPCEYRKRFVEGLTNSVLVELIFFIACVISEHPSISDIFVQSLP
jgi:hypothetical protein